MIYFDRLTIIFYYLYNFNLIKFCSVINIILYISKTYDYLKILTDKEVKDFLATIFSEYFKYTKEK